MQGSIKHDEFLATIRKLPEHYAFLPNEPAKDVVALIDFDFMMAAVGKRRLGMASVEERETVSSTAQGCPEDQKLRFLTYQAVSDHLSRWGYKREIVSRMHWEAVRALRPVQGFPSALVMNVREQ